MLTTINNCLIRRKLRQVVKIAACNLNLLEYQSKNLLKNNAINVQDFVLIENSQEISESLQSFRPSEFVIKAQVLAGGRGKGHFDNGFKGGVHITKDPKKVDEITRAMIGHRLITKQTPKLGIPVNKVMVAESVNIKRETYLCILLDREHNGPVIVASPAGGVDIETVAKETPELIKTFPVDIFEGITDKIANDIALFLKFDGALQKKTADQIKKMWELFTNMDCIQLEINPLVETDEGNVIAVDAKLAFDDNSKFRHKTLYELHDTTESDPREIEASKWNLNYIPLDGNIGCLVNGAGLAMATMDIIKLHGGQPANFLDVGGGVKDEQVFNAVKILTTDKNVKSILVNVFGGIVNCATIANGIVRASKELNLNIPLVVRLEGTNVNEAKKIIKNSGCKIESASDLEDAAVKAVQSIL